MRPRVLLVLSVSMVVLFGGLIALPSTASAAGGDPISPRGVMSVAPQRFALQNGRLTYRGNLRITPLLAANLDRARANHLSAGSAVRRSIAASLLRAGAAPAAVQAEASPGGSSGTFLEPAGDLNGDGLPDLIGQRFDDAGAKLIVQGIRGVDGSVLWTQSIPNVFGYAFPASFGAKGRPGALVLSYTFGHGAGAFLADAGTYQMQLTAISGRGRVGARKAYRGVFSDAYPAASYYEFPYLAGFEHAAPGTADDFLLGDEKLVVAPKGFASTVDAQIVRGSDGSTIGSSTMRGVDREPFPVPITDVSGDGLDDYLFVSGGNSSGEVSARAGSDGSEIWDRKGEPITPYSFVVPAGDPTGDGRGDAVVMNFDFFGPGSIDPSTVVLLSGANGSVAWRRAGDFALPIGDVNGDGRTDIGTVSVTTGSALGVAYGAVDGSGNGLYQKAYAVSVPPGDNTDASLDLWVGAGDVQPDGVLDSTHDIEVTDLTTHAVTSSSGVVSGSTGDLVRPGPVGQPLFGSVDGRGDDFAQVSPIDTSTTQVAPQDGLTGGTLWTASVATPQNGFAWAFASDLDGDGHAEVIVQTDGYDDQTGVESITDTVLHGTDGSVIWSR